jgi:N-glycosylase/DNA lyase
VPFDVAVAAADAIDAEGLLLEPVDLAALESSLTLVLRQATLVGGRRRRYRFPSTRAKHLAATRAAVTRAAGGLASLLSGFGSPADARLWFVANAPGIGPKQASMFLRNTGTSYDLAVLDRHVLNYMAALGMYQSKNRFISNLIEYGEQEAKLRSHAEELGFAVGLVDWAIWIVMRAARCLHLESATS